MTPELHAIAEATGIVWKVEVAVGQAVAKGELLLVLESMKMEIPVEAPCAGVVSQLLFSEGESVVEGSTVAIVRASA